MKTLQGIYATDEINRYNEKFTFEALFNAYEEQWLEYFPFNANHDMTMPLGCSKLTGIYISPGKTYATNVVYIGETDEEEKRVVELGFNSLYNREMSENEKSCAELTAKLGASLKSKGVKHVKDGCFIYEKDLVKRAFPELCENIDYSGLIDLNLLTPILPGVYKVGKQGEFVIYAHRYFRRGFSLLNALNVDFLSRLEQLRGTDAEVRIAIDMDCVGLTSTQQIGKEYEYWWGPKFDDDLTEIPFGLTVHHNERFSELMSPIKKTEFRWYEQGGRHTFECEEIYSRINLTSEGNNYYGCRFVHSMVDYEKKQPVHLDGAIRAYTQDKMVSRENTTLDRTGRDTYYTKLWRVDNAIPITTWKELITHYYRDNMQIGEYFNGRDKIIDELESKDEQKNAIQLSDFVPCYLSRTSGLRLKVTYHTLPKHSQEEDVNVTPTTYVTSERGRIVIVESMAVTLHKLLRKNGLTLEIPQVEYANYQDGIFNLPLYKCKSSLIANDVLLVIKDFINCMIADKLDCVISFSLEIPYESRSAILSFIGHSACFQNYFNSEYYKPIPNAERDMCDWCTCFYKGITALFGNNNDVDPLHLVQENDLLVADRKYIKSKYIEDIVQDDRGVQLLFKLNDEEREIFLRNRLTCRAAFIEKKVECSKCKTDYLKCDCILFKDKDVCRVVKKAELIGYCWAVE